MTLVWDLEGLGKGQRSFQKKWQERRHSAVEAEKADKEHGAAQWENAAEGKKLRPKKE